MGTGTGAHNSAAAPQRRSPACLRLLGVQARKAAVIDSKESRGVVHSESFAFVARQTLMLHGLQAALAVPHAIAACTRIRLDTSLPQAYRYP